MKYFFLIFFSFLLGCNNSSDDSYKRLTRAEKDSIQRILNKCAFDELNLKMNTTTLKNRIYYGNDSIRIPYKEIELGKYKLTKNKQYFIVNSKEEAQEVFLSCDSINKIDFDKYTLIGRDHPQNGFEKISPVVVSISKEKQILIYLNSYKFTRLLAINGRIKKWILIEKPKINWEIKVLINTTFPLDN